MNIEEAKQKKNDLENAIAILCKEFEEATDLKITDLDIYTIDHGLIENSTRHVQVTCKI